MPNSIQVARKCESSTCRKPKRTRWAARPDDDCEAVISTFRVIKLVSGISKNKGVIYRIVMCEMPFLIPGRRKSDRTLDKRVTRGFFLILVSNSQSSSFVSDQRNYAFGGSVLLGN